MAEIHSRDASTSTYPAPPGLARRSARQVKTFLEEIDFPVLGNSNCTTIPFLDELHRQAIDDKMIAP
jgi:hypothetical protein